MRLKGGDDPGPHVVEMPLKHGQYEGTPFSTGTSVTGDDTCHWVFTEGDEGPRIGCTAGGRCPDAARLPLR